MTDDDHDPELVRAALLFTMDQMMQIQRGEIVKAPGPWPSASAELERMRYYRRCIESATADELAAVRSGIDPFPPEGVPPLIH